MKRLFTGTCLAAFCAATLSAQTPSQPPASAPPQDTMKTVTATGCLRAGEQPNTFVLSNVKWADKAAGRNRYIGYSGSRSGGQLAQAGGRRRQSADRAHRQNGRSDRHD